MPRNHLDNYLRTFRRRFGLSQDEVAFLLGGECGTKVSRYESGRRVPYLETALAYEALFQVPVRELFHGKFETVEQAIRVRAMLLAEAIEGNLSAEARAKRELLARLAPDSNIS